MLYIVYCGKENFSYDPVDPGYIEEISHIFITHANSMEAAYKKAVKSDSILPERKRPLMYTVELHDSNGLVVDSYKF